MTLPGGRIKARRKELGLTQVQLARLCGITQSSLSDLENGESIMPKSETLMRLSKALAVSQAWIMTGQEGELEMLTTQEESHIKALRGMTAEQRQAVYTLVETLTSSED